MKQTKHPISFPYKEIYPNVEFISAFEGGGYFKASKDNKHYLIIDEGTLADFINDNDKDLLDQLITAYEFDTEAELRQYFVSQHLSLEYLHYYTWSRITREERYFTAELYFEIRKDTAKFINFLNDHNYLKLNPNEMWEVGYEVCFYRDYLYSQEQSIRNDYNGIKYPQKRTFDLCLFSKSAILIIEAKVFENFNKKQLIDLHQDVYGSRVRSLIGREQKEFQILGLLLFSSEKKFKENDLTKNFGKFTWSDLYNYYENEIFFRADYFGGRRE